MNSKGTMAIIGGAVGIFCIYQMYMVVSTDPKNDASILMWGIGALVSMFVGGMGKNNTE